MTYFFCKLLPPRPTFPADMTPAEAGLMQQHAGYWRNQLETGHVIAVGPVADPKGTFGVVILQLADGMDPRSLTDNDPVVAAGVGFHYEVHPMPSLMLPASRG